MRTDSIWYKLFLQFPSTYFELINQPSTLGPQYQFGSHEVKELKFRLDGIFTPRDPTSPHPIHFTEVQFQKDPKIYSRLLTEIFIYLRQTHTSTQKQPSPQKQASPKEQLSPEEHLSPNEHLSPKEQPLRDWRATLIFHKRTLDPPHPIWYREFFDSQRIQIIYLDELPNTTDTLGLSTANLIICPDRDTLPQAQTLLKRATTDLPPSQANQFIDLIERILIYKLPTLTQKELKTMMGTGSLKHTRIYQELKEELGDELRQKILGQMVPELLAMNLSQDRIAEITGCSPELIQQVINSLPPATTD